MRAAALACVILALAASAAWADPADPAAQCRQAIQAAEREHRLPTGLLLAIGTVEAGRPDPGGGSGVAVWPWTMNAEGQGRFFDTKAEAIAAVEALRARGIRLVDVGCLQVNLLHHPQAFPDLETAFDPAANARYAGLFLKRLQAQTKSWDQAAANYHSATPELGDAYRQQVMAAWPAMAARLAAEQRREAMIAAWAGGKDAAAAPVNGFQVVALATRGSAAKGRGQPLLLMGTPALRPGAAAPRGPRRALLLEVAEARPDRR